VGLVRFVPVVLLAIVGMTLAGCAAHSVDESAYVRANGRVLRSVPRPPGSRLVSSYSIPDRSGNGWPDGGPVTSYATTYSYSTSPGYTQADILGFYDRRMRSSGWTLRLSVSNERTFSKHSASVYLTAEATGFTLSIDYLVY
jgi:hypothetical protein